MRVSLVLGTSLLGLIACGSSTTTTTSAAPTGLDAGVESGAPGAGELATLGQSCSGGCSPGKVCLFHDDSCAPGICAVDARDALRSYCSVDCATAPCPSGFDCVTTLTDQRVCVATGKATCGDHIVDEGEACDNGGTAPLECTAACKVAPATLRATTLHALRTTAPDDPGVFEMKSPQTRVTVPYDAPWSEVPRDGTVDGVASANVQTKGDAIRVTLILQLPNRDTSQFGIRSSVSTVIDANLKREAGHFEAASVLIPAPESNGTTCTPSGAFDVELSGKRTYLVTFKYGSKCVWTSGGRAYYDETVEGALEIAAPP